ncbi:MAG TPA: VIT1/CCC1 transporter family protein [bacterium]
MSKTRLRDARKAHEGMDLESSREAHSERAIKESLEEPTIHDVARGQYIGDMVYGAIDGIVTTFAVVSGVAGAELSAGIVLILGFANLFADGLSMAVGNYLGAKSENEYKRRERYREEWEIEHLPEEEKQEIRQIYHRKGFTGELLERVVEVITRDKKQWVDTMLLEELHIVPEQTSPIMSGFMTFASFVIAGFVPLFSYVLSYFVPFFAEHAYPLSVGLTFATIFIVGSLRVYVTGKRWWTSGLEMLLVGGATAVVAYFIGYLLRGLA